MCAREHRTLQQISLRSWVVLHLMLMLMMTTPMKKMMMRLRSLLGTEATMAPVEWQYYQRADDDVVPVVHSTLTTTSMLPNACQESACDRVVAEASARRLRHRHRHRHRHRRGGGLSSGAIVSSRSRSASTSVRVLGVAASSAWVVWPPVSEYKAKFISSKATLASSCVTSLRRRHFACAVARRIIVSSERGVTGAVYIRTPTRKSEHLS